MQRLQINDATSAATKTAVRLPARQRTVLDAALDSRGDDRLLLGEDSASIFDPAVGAGAFLRAAKDLAQTQGRQLALRGAELDREVLQQALSNGLSAEDLAQVEVRDFVLHPPDNRLPAIVANPPYIRHHRLAATTKEALRRLSAELIGESLDGRAQS